MADIALIGMAGRFPGAASVEELWRNVAAGVESISRLTRDQLLAAGVPAEVADAPGYVPARGVLEGVDRFDAELFGYSPREAELLDPQHRLFLRCVFEALENAALVPGAESSVGLFASCAMPTYLLAHVLAHPEVVRAAGEAQVELANDKDYLATRVSYKLNLRGPSLAVQTACSSSLVAIHLACQALQTFQCDVAVAGGVSVRLPQGGYPYQEGGVFSPDGHVRTFDASAKGMVPGAGVGAVVLKRLEDAIADGDFVYAVVKGSAVNNDGDHKVGYTAASVAGQAEAIVSAHSVADVAPRSIGLVEAHGTATPMGDPIEVEALTRAFRLQTEDRGFCAIGSLKTNLGHLDTAAGVAGFIKAALAVHHGALPPSLHFERPNPAIRFEESPFFVNTALRPWPVDSGPRRAAVSSFGIGGTNAHVVLEQAPARAERVAAQGPQLLPLSARSPEALRAAAATLAARLTREPVLSLGDVAHTLQRGRRLFGHRRAIVAADAGEAARALLIASETRDVGERRPTVSFLFPGQGSQFAGMGAALYSAQPVFRAAIDRCAEHLRATLDLRELLFRADAGTLAQTRVLQPALFALEWSLAQLLQSWGIAPAGLLGHSVGEYVAATLAGVFALPDALSLIAARGACMQQLPAGAMLAVSLSEAEALGHCGERVSLAAVNGPRLCVLAGEEGAISALERSLQPVGAKRLRTSHAFHSAMMDPVLESYERLVRAVPRGRPTLPFVSNLTGRWITAEEAVDPAYWARHLRAPVRFADGVRTLASAGDGVLLEVGPGKALGELARQTAPQLHGAIPVLGREDDARSAIAALGALFEAGVALDWDRCGAEPEARKLPLPGYAFQEARHWLEPAAGSAAHPAAAPAPASRLPMAAWLSAPSFKRLPPLPAPAEGGWLRLGSAWPEGAAHATVPLNFDTSEEALTAALRALGELPSRAVWSCPAGADPLKSVLVLSRAWRAAAGDRPLRLGLVVSGALDVSGDEALDPRFAALAGWARALPRELPNVRCTLVDVPSLERAPWGAVLAEVASGTESVIALRGETSPRRWAASLEPLPPTASCDALGPGKRGGVYLITGGLGGIGLTLAGRLAKAGEVTLALLTRSALPPRSQWTPLLSGPSTTVARRVRAVLALEAQGARVELIVADVAEAAELDRAVKSVIAAHGRLDGVIHAAGVGQSKLLADLSLADAHAVWAPKLDGAKALAAAVQGLPLDFFVLCSSLSAQLGELGQGAYAAANAALDAFAAEHQARTGIFTTAIGWDAWAEVGMAADTGASGPSGRPVAHPLLHTCVSETAAQRVYETRFEVARDWVLSEHRIRGRAVLPGTTYLDMACGAFADACPGVRPELSDVLFVAPLQVGDAQVKLVQTVLEADGEAFRFVVKSRDGAAWREHVRGRVGPLRGEESAPADLPAIRARCGVESVQTTSEVLGQQQHMTYGQRWHNLTQLDTGDGERLGHLELPAALVADLDVHPLHPALFDVATALAMHQGGEGFYLPLGYERISLLRRLPARLFSHVRYRAGAKEDRALVCDLSLLDADGRECVSVKGFSMVRTDAAAVFDTPNDAALRPEEGAELFARIVSARLGPSVVVATRPIEALLRETSEQAARAQAPAPSSHARPALKSAYVAPTDDVERTVAAAWSELLGVDRVGLHDNFFELGGHSLMSVQLVSRLKATFGLELPLASFFATPTVAGVSQVIRTHRLSQAEAAEVDALVDELEQLAPEQLEALLAGGGKTS